MAITRIGPNQSINLASNITGTLPVANGGTAITSGFINGTATPGKVLQVVSHENTYEQTSSSTSLVDVLVSSGTTWEPSITPTVSTSTILILASIHIAPRDNSDTQQEKRFNLHCDAKVGSGSYSDFVNTDYIGQYYYNGTSRSQPMEGGIYNVFSKEYDHNTTDEVKFRWQYQVLNGSSKVGLHGGSRRSTVTFMELA